MTETMDRAINRGSLMRTAGAAGAGLALGSGLFGATIARASGGVTKGDIDILIAAEIAEALAVTTYTNIINRAPFFKHLAADDQGYLKAARQEEMSHYALEKSVTGKPSPFTEFFYPHGMFRHAQTTLNTLVTLEDAWSSRSGTCRSGSRTRCTATASSSRRLRAGSATSPPAAQPSGNPGRLLRGSRRMGRCR